jgi:hypothetical protein
VREIGFGLFVFLILHLIMPKSAKFMEDGCAVAAWAICILLLVFG